MTTTQRLLHYRQRLQAYKRGLDNNDPLATWGGEPQAEAFGLGSGPAGHVAKSIREEIMGRQAKSTLETQKTPPRAVSAPLRGGLEPNEQHTFPSTPAETMAIKKDDKSLPYKNSAACGRGVEGEI